MARASILALYRYDNTIFDYLYLPTGIDKNLVINNIILSCAELSLVYLDAGMMRDAIKCWSTAMLPGWNKLYRAVTTEYDPISNYDRKENWTDTQSGTNTTTGSVAGFNEDVLKPSSQAAAEGSTTAIREGRAYGNIGVTTTQQMLQAEWQVAKLNAIDEIVNDFKAKFCIMVY